MDKARVLGITLTLLVLTGCSLTDKVCCNKVLSGICCDEEKPEPTPAPTPPPVVTPTPEPEPGNPPCSTLTFNDGKSGLLWKPQSDHAPQCVMLIDREFVKEFQCTAKLQDGSKDKMRFTGFSNGYRQTHRCNHVAGKYEWRTEIRCDDGQKTCTFRLPGSPQDRHD